MSPPSLMSSSPRQADSVADDVVTRLHRKKAHYRRLDTTGQGQSQAQRRRCRTHVLSLNFLFPLCRSPALPRRPLEDRPDLVCSPHSRTHARPSSQQGQLARPGRGLAAAGDSVHFASGRRALRACSDPSADRGLGQAACGACCRFAFSPASGRRGRPAGAERPAHR